MRRALLSFALITGVILGLEAVRASSASITWQALQASRAKA
jgi:hypothetical protein